jgi:hypothetical protein
MDEQNMLLDLKLIGQTMRCVVVGSWRPPRKQPLLVEHQARDQGQTS